MADRGDPDREWAVEGWAVGRGAPIDPGMGMGLERAGEENRSLWERGGGVCGVEDAGCVHGSTGLPHP